MKKLFILIFCMILLVGTISATMEWDNVLHYEQKDGIINKVAVIENAFGLPLIGSTIAKIELITPIHNYVEKGENVIVMVFNIETYGDDYKNGIGIFDIINMQSSKSTDKKYHLEYAIYGEIEVEDKENVCKEIYNKINQSYNQICKEEIMSYHTEQGIVRWEEIRENKIPKGKITIALITDVKAGDYYDGIPDLFGKKIRNWAIWEEAITDSLPDTDDTTELYTIGLGPKINATNDTVVTRIVSVEKFTECTATQALITALDGTYIGSALFVGDVATFDESINNSNITGEIFVFAWSNGASYNRRYDLDGTTYPIAGTNINFIIGGNYPSLGTDMGLQNIWKITTQRETDTELDVNQSFPAHNLFTTNTTMDFGCNFTSVGENITDVTILVYDSSDNLDYTDTESGLNIQSYNKTWLGNVLDEDTYSWACYGEGDLTDGYAGNKTFTIDSTAPIINITYPTTIVNYHIRGNNLTLNWSILDTTLESCWYNYNSTNISATCSDNSTQFTVTEYSNRNLTFYANDSLGHDSSEFISWDYKVFQTNVTYRSITTEGATETFGLDFTQVQAFPTSTMTLIYNNTDYSSIFSIIDNEVTGTNVIGIPNQNVASNPEFYWSILMSDGSVINTTTYNQTVNILQVDDCSTYNHLIYNYTLLDEENQSRLSNTSIEIQLNLYDLSRRNLILNFSALYTDVNPAMICFNNSLLNTINYSVDSVVKYTSTNVSYSKEYYNILGDVFTNSTVPNHIYLYALLSADSTDFQLTFRDQSLSLAANVIVYVYRQYIADNDFKIVEAPLTDSNGQTVLHLVRNDVIYNFVMKDSSGKIIATFNKIIAFCQDYTVGSCEIDLSATGEGDAFYNYLEDVGISYSTSYSNVTELISFEFITDDLSAKTVQIDVIRNSDFGNRTVCQETLTSASGIITCDVSAITSTDRYLFIDISVDGDSKAKSTIDLEADSFNFGLYGSFIAFFIILIFVLIFMEDKQTLVIAIVLGWITVIALGLIKGKVVGVLSGTLWLIVSAIIFLWKLKQEESR